MSSATQHVSVHWTLPALQKARSRVEAASYFGDYWCGWIGNPMLHPIAHGAWAQLCLASIAIEAIAYHTEPMATLTKRHYDAKSILNRRGEVLNNALYKSQFARIFDSSMTPSGMTLKMLAEITYGSIRCGLAHRGLTVKSKHHPWIAAIDAQADVFAVLPITSSGVHVLCVDPERFAKHVDRWVHSNVITPLRRGTSTHVDGAFKEWCMERWNIPPAQWSF